MQREVGFNVYLIDSGGNIMEELNSFAQTFLQTNGTYVPTSDISVNYATLLANLTDYSMGADPQDFYSSIDVMEGYEAGYGGIIEVIPKLAAIYNKTNPNNYRIKIVNGSGLYAIGNLDSNFTVSSWYLYDTQDVQLALIAGRLAEVLPYGSRNAFPVPFATFDSEGNFTSATWQLLRFTLNTTAGSVRRYGGSISAISQAALSWFNGLTKEAPRPPEPPSSDPYADGGYSGPGGGPGTGTFDLDSDVIGLPPRPTLSFASTGFTRIYNPSLSELNALANYLWTDQTFLDTVINHLKQLLENPMDAVISLSLLPCSIPNGTPEAVKVMYINTGVSMAPATTQFVDVDCGTYSLQEFYGSALDYNPYTKVHCYLPYIGQVTLDTDEVMGRTLHVVYRIDIVTGMCAAMILVDQNVLYQFSGHCSINMPINSADFSGYIGAAMTAGKMVAGVVAGATGNLPLAGELIGAPAPKVTSTSQTTETVKSRNPKTGRQVTQWSDTKARETTASGASFGEMTRKAISNSVSAVMGSKLTVEHAGGFTGNSGYLAVRRPYLIIERPRMCNPEEYGRYNGRPSMIYMNLGECEGYTEVQSIQFENVPATNPELAELSELLKSGVLF